MTEILEKTEDLEEISYARFTEHDRCDACGARAYVEAVFVNGELLFCGHHATKFWDQIESQAVRLIDQRSDIG